MVTPLLARYSEAVRDYVLPTSNYQFAFSTNPLDKLHLVNEFIAITFNLWTSNYFPEIVCLRSVLYNRNRYLEVI